MSTGIQRNADGSTEGLDPRTMPREVLATLHQPRPILAAIRAKCLDCCCGQESEVRKCTAVRCSLWPYRMAASPFHTRHITEERRAQMREQVARLRRPAK